jgi:uncharacterized membrane protein
MNTKTPISPDAAKWRYQWNVVVAMLIYCVVVLICVKLLKHMPPGPLRIALALLPAVPVVWVLWSVIWYLRVADELQRRVHLESLAIAAGVTAFVSLTYGLLEQLGGFPMVTAWWGFIILDVVWGFTACILFRRYK